MKILVDTPVWSLAFRKKPNTAVQQELVDRLIELIKEVRTVLIGPIRQELLSGISDEKKFTQLKEKLRFFEDAPLETSHYELAASFFKQCRSRGIQGSLTDFLICAVSVIDHFPIFTLDKDFERYQRVLNIKLFPFPEDRRHV